VIARSVLNPGLTVEPRRDWIERVQATMAQSRLFMSSISRRQLARRRPGRSVGAGLLLLLLVLIVVAIIVAAFLLGHGSL